MPEKLDNVLYWGDIEQDTLLQAARTARLPFLGGHLALMPDAHIGKGSTVGSVIPTIGAIIPAAIGVDIGCGMAAIETNLFEDDLPDDFDTIMSVIEKAIPAGKGKGQTDRKQEIDVFAAIGSPQTELDRGLQTRVANQCGTLGSGNHFFEICLDERGRVWIVLHSGSRNIGKTLAEKHIKIAEKLMKDRFITLEDHYLSYLSQSDDEFKNYIADMLWAQDYARLNRETMLKNIMIGFKKWFSDHSIQLLQLNIINCHHNFTQMENHFGKNMWITRKGAIKASQGDIGIIPGSMGTATYIIEGLGNPSSYNSCSHGAGRRYSRSKAKSLFNAADLERRMEGKVWNVDRAASLVDEIPDAYKDIEQVMLDQEDLVTTVHILTQILNYKG